MKRLLSRLKYYLIFIFLFGLLSLSTLFYNYQTLTNYISLKEQEALSNYQQIIRQMEQGANIVYDNSINTPEIISIFKKAAVVSVQEQQQIRDKLYKALKPVYQNIQKNHMKIVQFHLPNGSSFLRFHNPEYFGDSLTGLRNSVAYVQTEKMPFKGFETGRFITAYRFVYPLFDNSRTFLGSVEISYPAKEIKALYESQFDHALDVVLKKEIVNANSHKNGIKNYIEYPVNKDFLMHKSLISPIYHSGIYAIIKQNREIGRAMRHTETFSTYAKYKDHFDIISLLPIKNEITDQSLAYAVIFTKSTFLLTLFQTFYIQIFLAFTLSLILTMIYYREHKIKIKLQESSDITRTILDSSVNFIAVIDGNSVKEANRSFLKFFGISDLDNLYDYRTNLSTAFIKYADYYYPSKDKKGLWVNELLRYQPQDRIISMIGIDCNPKALQVSITPLKNRKNQWVVILNDITNLEIENNSLKKQAHYDELTGVYNRRYFEKSLHQRLLNLKKEYSSFSLIMLDIDHFKNINDTYGHDIGDEALKLLVQIIQNNIRDSDILARWGGEEFMILINTNEKNAKKVAEHLRIQIEEKTDSHENIPSFTCSFGVIALDQTSDIKRLYKEVDKKLYNAKEQGRNMVIA